MKQHRLVTANRRLATGVKLSSAVASILAMAGVAQAASAPALEEIIVTAERRATSEQTTAISMDVLTADSLAESRTQTINELQNATPSLVVNTQGISQVVNIRGIGNSISSPNVTTGVGIYTDGLLAGEPQNIAGAVLDVDTIEVLRGPQGTFVGQASTGGAIRINSKRPTFDGLNGFVEAVYGKYNNTKVSGAVNLPISDTWAARLAFNSEQRDSFFNNVGGQTGREPFEPLLQPGKVDARNIRASLLWQPNDNFSALVRADYTYSSDDGPTTQPNPRTFNSPVVGSPGRTIALTSQYWAYDDPQHDPWVVYSNNLGLTNTSTVYRNSLDLRYKFDSGHEVRSLTGVQNNLVRDVEDGDASAATTSPVQLNIGPESNYYTQELTLVAPDAPLNWVVGTTWYYRQAPVTSGGPTYAAGGGTSTNCGVQGSGAVVACVPNPTILRYGFSSSRTIQRMGGVFGQLNWQFTDEWQASVGARYSIDRNFNRSGGQRQPTAFPAGAPGIPPGTVACPSDLLSSLPPGTTYTCSFPAVTNQMYEGEEATWKVGLNWSPGGQGGDQFLYAFYARGYKPGGVNGNGRPFEEEHVDDYELGWKGQLADGRVQLSLGGYWMDYKNMQQSVWTAGNFGAASLITNIGESTIKGLEFEVRAALGNFTVGLNSAYIDSELGDVSVIDQRSLPGAATTVPPGQAFAPPECAAAGQTGCFDYRGLNPGGTNYYVDLSGVSNVYSPKMTYTLSADYSFDTGNGTWRPAVSFTHTDKQYTFLFQDDFFSLDERNLTTVSLNYERDDWSGQLYCTNCADKTYIAAMDSRAPFNVYYGAPRQIGIRLKKTF